MKKRFLSLLLIISMLLTVLPASNVFAEEVNSAQPTYSQWAFEDLVVGDSYGIYPMGWYEKDMQTPITQAKLRVLMAGLRKKLVKSECVVDYNEQIYRLSNKMTVEEVLEFLYTLVSDYEFNKEIGTIDDVNALEYMTKYGIFTGNEAELSLKDICTVEQACVFATRLITYLYDVLEAGSKGFLWEINSGENKVYLLGSIHMANYDIYPFDEKMLDAFAEADALGVEVNLLDASVDPNSLYSQYGMYTDGTTFKDHVSEETYLKTIQVGEIFGLTEDVINMFKPWVLFNTFVGLSNTSNSTVDEAQLAAQLGIDMKFLIDAFYSGKPIIELESYELQIKMLDSFSDELEEYLLSSTVDSVVDLMNGVETGGNESINMILDYWHEGDVEGFMEDIAPLLVASETPDMDEEDKEEAVLMEEYFNKLFTERDKGMAEKIDEMLKAPGSTTYFVVVGTGHYISDYSVLDILEEMGYYINQIK